MGRGVEQVKLSCIIDSGLFNVTKVHFIFSAPDVTVFHLPFSDGAWSFMGRVAHSLVLEQLILR